MARPNPKTVTTNEVDESDDEFFAFRGEWVRRIALGLTAGLLTARAFWPSEPIPATGAGTGLVWVLWIIIAAGLGLLSALVGGSLRFRWSWTDAAVIALMFLVGISTAEALDRRPAINLAWEWIGLGFAYLLVRNLPRTAGESAALTLALTATAVSVAVYGLYQVGVELEPTRAAYRAHPERALLMLGIDPQSPARVAFEHRLLHSTEPWSTFALANSLAGFLVGPLVLLLGLAWNNARVRVGLGSRRLVVALAALPALALLVCLLLTKSRSAYAGLAVALAVLAWRERRRVRARTLALATVGVFTVLGLLIGAGVASGKLDREVLTEATKSLNFRRQYWVGAWRVITETPWSFWAGRGPGNFGWAYVGHKLPEASEEIVDPHNLVLEVWAMAGVVAALALIAALGLGAWDLLARSRPELGDPLSEKSAPIPPGWLLVCSGMGWVIVVAFGRLNPLEPDLFFRWLILGVSWFAAVMLVRPLWLRLPMEATGCGAGALAVVVNLLAAGGIGIPTVALTLWTLIALGLNLREDRNCGRIRTFAGRLPAFGVGLVFAALAGLFAGGVGPYWAAEDAMAEAEAALRAKTPNFSLARTAYLRAIEADRLSPLPWIGTARLEYRAWLDAKALPENSLWKRVPVALAEAVKPPRNPNAWTIHRDRAVLMRELLETLGPRLSPAEALKYRANVVEASRKATLLYPSNANLHALLAEASAEIGMTADAAQEADDALRLDRLTPHVDKKLPEAVRKRLESRREEWRNAR